MDRHLSIWHLLLLLNAVLWIVPFWRIFPRAGWPAALSVLMAVPFVSLILAWILGFKRWPGEA